MLFFILCQKNQCCAPAVRCGTAQDQTREQRIQPKEKMLQTHQSPNINPLHCVGGPIKQQLERGPHYSTNNVQTCVMYNNPNQYCAPRTPAICCAGLPKGTHITTVLPPIRERLPSDALILVQRIPIKARNRQTNCSHTNNGLKFNDSSTGAAATYWVVGAGSAHRMRFPPARETPTPVEPIPVD